MFLHKKTGIIYDNRLDAVIVMGQSRYKRALKNCEFDFSYELKDGENPIKVNHNK